MPAYPKQPKPKRPRQGPPILPLPPTILLGGLWRSTGDPAQLLLPLKLREGRALAI